MATLLALPTITRVRPTYVGMQYTIMTPGYLDIVTVNGSSITCTCRQYHCSHIQVVEQKRAEDKAANARRDLHNALFNL